MRGGNSKLYILGVREEALRYRFENAQIGFKF